MSNAETWANTWGEVVSKKVAAKMLGISYRQIFNLIERGELQTSVDGRVLVREACEYMHGKAKPKRFVC